MTPAGLAGRHPARRHSSSVAGHRSSAGCACARLFTTTIKRSGVRPDA